MCTFCLQNSYVMGKCTIRLVWDAYDTLAFAECPNLEYVRLEGSYNIRCRAFFSCPKLKKIRDYGGILGLTKLNLGYEAFCQCPNLQSLDSIVISKLGIASFYGCTSLEGVILEDSIIPASAFGSCKALSSITTAYRDYKGNLHETTIKKVGYNAFGGCSNLESFNANLDTLSDDAFSDCEKLRSVHLGDRIRTIGEFAFWLCKALREVSLGDSIRTIGSYAFGGCKALMGISLGDSIRYIGENAFIGTGLTGIRIPYYAKIGDGAFKDCVNLRKVVFTAPVTFPEYEPMQLGGFAFMNDSSLVSVEGETAWFGDKQITVGPKEYQYDTFRNCVRLQSIPNSEVTKIGERTFMGCTGITNVDLRETIIGESAFMGCTGITNVDLRQSTIGERTFMGCTGIRKVDLRQSTIGESAFMGFTGITHADLRQSTIGESAFMGCTGITNVDLRESAIGDSAFMGCTGITHADLCQARSIGSNAFKECTGLTSIAISDVNDMDMYDNSFTSCTKLHIIDVYPSDENESVKGGWLGFFSFIDTLRLHDVKNIGDYAFQNCSNLKGISLGGNSIRNIGNYAFQNCSNLKEISLGDSIRNIGNYAFSSVEGLTKIKIPYYAKIGDYAFQNCKNLKEVSFTAPRTFEVYVPTQLGKYVFSGCSSLEKFSHQEAHYGSPYKWHCWVGPKAIPEGGFENCTSLTSIPFLHSRYPSNLRLDSIGAYAFRGCTGLESINFESTRKVGPGAFYGCSSAREIYVNDAWWYIGAQAFYGCSSAREIYINGPSIGAQTFEGCSSAETLTIGASVDSIGSNAFNGTAIKGDINIYAWSNPPVCAPDAFGDVDKCACNLVIHVPTLYDVDGNNFEDSYEYQQLQEMYETSWERYLHYDEYKTQYIVSQLQQQDYDEKYYLEKYKKADVWKDFYEDESIPTSIEKANMEGGAEPKPLEYYGTNGIRTTSPKKGVNIVRMSDGTVRKVIF